LYRGQKYCRQRSVESVILELEHAKSMPATRMISVYDDLFTFNREWVLEFAAQYKSRIALPFWCYTHPSKVNKEVFEALVDAGLENTAMGVQSGSERVLYEVFNRKTPRSKILEAAAVLKDLRCRAQIDLITANPFETDDDRRDTLDLMLAMPKNTKISDYDRAWCYCQSRLTYFPNSRISQMVEEQGIDTDFNPDVASFWEMLHELAFLDYLPPSAVMYLSYLYDEFRTTARDFKPETGAEWIRMNLLDRPLKEISDLAGSGPDSDDIARASGWIPTAEELSVEEVRVIMDGVMAARAKAAGMEVARPEEAEGDEKERRVAHGLELLRTLSPERRLQRVKEHLGVETALVARLADRIEQLAAERQGLWKEIDARGKWALSLEEAVRTRDEIIRDLQRRKTDDLAVAASAGTDNATAGRAIPPSGLAS
jgi:hypothetical protein